MQKHVPTAFQEGSTIQHSRSIDVGNVLAQISLARPAVSDDTETNHFTVFRYEFDFFYELVLAFR